MPETNSDAAARMIAEAFAKPRSQRSTIRGVKVLGDIWLADLVPAAVAREMIDEYARHQGVTVDWSVSKLYSSPRASILAFRALTMASLVLLACSLRFLYLLHTMSAPIFWAVSASVAAVLLTRYLFFDAKRKRLTRQVRSGAISLQQAIKELL